jgi:hypothetical protein
MQSQKTAGLFRSRLLKRRIRLRIEPVYLIVLRTQLDGSVEEVFNRPGPLAWTSAGPMQGKGQCSIALSALRKLAMRVPCEERLPAAHG